MKKFAVGMLLSCSMVFVACGDDQSPAAEDPATITIGGTLSGLNEIIGNGVSDSLKVSLLASDGVETMMLYEGSNGAFAFEDKLEDGENYSVSIVEQPVSQVCTITNSSGQATGVNITNIEIECN